MSTAIKSPCCVGQPGVDRSVGWLVLGSQLGGWRASSYLTTYLFWVGYDFVAMLKAGQVNQVARLKQLASSAGSTEIMLCCRRRLIVTVGTCFHRVEPRRRTKTEGTGGRKKGVSPGHTHYTARWRKGGLTLNSQVLLQFRRRRRRTVADVGSEAEA